MRRKASKVLIEEVCYFFANLETLRPEEDALILYLLTYGEMDILKYINYVENLSIRSCFPSASLPSLSLAVLIEPNFP